MTIRTGRRWRDMIAIAIVIGLLAFAIFGPIANLFLWAFAEKWYFPNRFPQEFGVSFWGRVFSPRGGAVASLGTSVWIAVLTVVLSLAVAIPAGYALARLKLRWRGLILLAFLLLPPILIPPPRPRTPRWRPAPAAPRRPCAPACGCRRAAWRSCACASRAARS